MKNLLDGVEREVSSNALAKATARLDTFRQRLNRDSIARRRTRFQRELNALLGSNPFLRAAKKRYFSRRIDRLLKATAKIESKAERLLQRLENKKK